MDRNERQREWRKARMARDPDYYNRISAKYRKKHPGFSSKWNEYIKAKDPTYFARATERWKKAHPDDYLRSNAGHYLRKLGKEKSLKLVEEIFRCRIHS